MLADAMDRLAPRHVLTAEALLRRAFADDRHGFEVTRVAHLDGRPPVWTTRRAPRAAGVAR